MYFAIGHWEFGGVGPSADDFNNIFDNTNGIGTIIPTGGDAPVNVWWPDVPVGVTVLSPAAYTFDNNGFTVIVLCTPSATVTLDSAGKLGGTHTAAGASATIVTDSAADYPIDGLIGLTLANTTDGSSGTVTDNDGTTITVDDLTGGTDDQFEQNDTYTVSLTQNEWIAGRLTVTEAAAQPTLIFSHQPLKTNHFEGNPATGADDAITAMEAQTIKPVVFQAHVHSYQETIIENGIIYFNLIGDTWGQTATDTDRFSHAIVEVTGPTYTDINGQRCLVNLIGHGYQNSVDLSTALVGRWRLNETDGTAAAANAIIDSSGNAFHGTNSETVVSVSSPIGHGVSLDGTGDYINASDTIILDYPFSMNIWLRTTGTSLSDLLSIGKSTVEGRYFALELSAAGVYEYVLRPSTTAIKVSSGVTVNDGIWHMITSVSAANNDHKLYVDGALKVSSGTAKTWDTGATILNAWAIGRLEKATPSGLFTGDLSDARMYSGALSASDIGRLYSAGTTGLRHRYSTKKDTGFARTRGRY